MIYLDTNGFLNKRIISFDYVRREFSERCALSCRRSRPCPNRAKGRFVGRIWVGGPGFSTSSGLTGAYGGGSRTNYYFHFIAGE